MLKSLGLYRLFGLFGQFIQSDQSDPGYNPTFQSQKFPSVFSGLLAICKTYTRLILKEKVQERPQELELILILGFNLSAMQCTAVQCILWSALSDMEQADRHAEHWLRTEKLEAEVILFVLREAQPHCPNSDSTPPPRFCGTFCQF